jgi:DNA (cytosine-5)-methyltransferase 1
MTAYYNENDPNAAAWLRELIREGRIAPGDVDERSILDVKPDDLRAYTQCHFFAGIGVWSHALRCAGWPDGRPVWTGSCPCQPFSAAGKRGGTADERHLWPAWQWLVGQCRPDVVLGEQVASKDGLAWLDLVRTDLEGTDYAVGFFDLCAAGFGAPHIRQRLYFSARSMAEPAGERWERRRSGEARAEPGTVERPERLCASGRMADATDARHDEARQHERRPSSLSARPAEHGGMVRPTGPTNGFWRDADWLACRDERWRPVEPGTFPLAHGAAARVGRLRGYGNAIVAPQAEVFVEAYLAAERDGFVRLGGDIFG